MKGSPAYTLIELLIVVAIVSLVLIAGYTSYTTARDNQLLYGTAEHVSTIFRRASIYSQNARDEQAWGIKSDDRQTYIVLSKTDTGEIHQETTFTLPRPLTFAAPFTLWFSKGSGQVSQDTDITLESPRHKTAQISIKTSGTITVTSPK